MIPSGPRGIADRITRRLPLAEAGAPHSWVQLKRGHVRHTSILGGHRGSAWAAAPPRTRDPVRPSQTRTSLDLRPSWTRTASGTPAALAQA